MKLKALPFIVLTLVLVLTVSDSCFTAGNAKTVKLLKPEMKGGMPLMEAISKRQTSRSFSDKPLSDQVLSNLLWAAYGINRKDSKKRTAPSAMDKQEIDVYAALKDGMYLYNAKEHQLVQVSDKDLRALTGKQPFVKNAAVNLVYVADMDKVGGESTDDRLLYAGADAGFIGQNVYLFCASEGLSTVIRAYIDREPLSKAMNLKPGQKIILSQSVGYPAK